jgi:glycosyltransferase involved in cell wall biosynthesis
MPKVSVIIPNYNHVRYLRQRIESVLEQTYQDFEVILMDDCSTDDSRTVISEYVNDPRIRIELNENNSGSTFKQWNKGVRSSGGEYVWLAESDDYADEKFLERLVPRLDAEPEAAFVYCRSWRVDDGNGLYGFVDQYLADLNATRWTQDYCSEGVEDCQKYFIFRNIVANASAVLFRKKAYEQVGGADESFQLCGDWKLWAAMALTGKVVHLGQPLNYFRFHDKSVSGRDDGRGVLALESLRVVRWILNHVTVAHSIRDMIFGELAELWIRAVLSGRVPVLLRLKILGNAMAMDPRAFRRMIRLAMSAATMKIRKIKS